MDTFEATVRDISAKGAGVVDHPNGQVFFVPGTWPGDRGVFTVESVEKRYGFARLEKLLEPSPARVAVPCPHQGHGVGQCGGCPWMMASYEAQLRVKEQMVRHLLARSQSLHESTVIRPIWGSPDVFGYRNRAQFKTDGQRLGFVSRESHVLAEIEDCLVLTEKNRETLKGLRSRLPRSEWRPGEGYRWSFLEIDEDVSAETVRPNERRPFRQGNSRQNERMREWVRERLSGWPRSAPLIELFAGSGNFTEVAVDLGFERIVAAEVVGAAVDDLRARNWPGVTPMGLNLFLPAAWNRLKKEARDAQILLLDPPREGFKEIPEFLENFRRFEAIYYISCETVPFSRDAARLRKLGWFLKEIQPLDQFPHTPYVELLAEFRREPL